MSDPRRKAAEEWVLRRNRGHEGARWVDVRDAHLAGSGNGEQRIIDKLRKVCMEECECRKLALYHGCVVCRVWNRVTGGEG